MRRRSIHRPPSTPHERWRRDVAGVLGLALLCLGVGSAALETNVEAAAATRTWTALLGNAGSAGSNGSATLVASWTGSGTLDLRLRRLTPGVSYAVALFRGPTMTAGTSWSSRGTRCRALSEGTLLRLPAVRAGAAGSVTRTIRLSTTQVSTLVAAPRKIAIAVGSGSSARCGSFTLGPVTAPAPRAPIPSLPPPPASIDLPSAVPLERCIPWPSAQRDVLDVLSTPADLCLVVFSDPAQTPEALRGVRGLYVPVDPPTVLYVIDSSGALDFHILAHEICHAHQDQVARQAGLPRLEGWYQTAAGQDFVRLTGWALRDAQWVGSESSAYPSPLEDNADVCAIWFDPTRGPHWLRRWAPERFDWAQRWLPLPSFIVPWQPLAPVG